MSIPKCPNVYLIKSNCNWTFNSIQLVQIQCCRCCLVIICICRSWADTHTYHVNHVRIQEGYSAIANSANFVQFSEPSEIQESERTLYPLRRESLDLIFQSKDFFQLITKGLMPARFFLERFWNKYSKTPRFFVIKTAYSALIFRFFCWGIFQKICYIFGFISFGLISF